ncbi:MAG: integrin alpha, partial [Candidatus Margulisbacteria bacterium]|nr:integrin alpha [Candidatus Margulisiibacteriota bacterium]
MLNKIKTLLGVCFLMLGTTAFLSAAGSYLETLYGPYDIQTPSQNDNITNKLTVGKQVFSGSVDEGISNTLFIDTPTIYNNMSTDSFETFITYNTSGTNKGKYGRGTSGTDEQRYEMKKPNRSNSEKLLPGFPAVPKSQAKKKTLGIFDVYPGTANIINNENLKVSFKVYAVKDSSEKFVQPYMDLSRVTVSITVKKNDGSRVTINTETFIVKNATTNPELEKTESFGSDGNSEWTTYITTGHNDGQAYGFNFIYKDTKIDAGSIVRVVIDAPFAEKNSAEHLDYEVLMEGVPFLERVVSNNTESGKKDDNNATLNAQLYGWTAAGGGDINGDGFPDLVVGDPYYKYSNNNIDGMRTGRVYIYFGGPDKILSAEKLPTPDIYIENPAASSNAKPRDREFGFKVKLADINNDGLADIIVGQPSYHTQGDSSVNQGRILIYYGGKHLKDGSLSMNTSKIGDVVYLLDPSIEINLGNV